MKEDDLVDWRNSKHIPLSSSKDAITDILKNAIKQDQSLEIVYSGGSTPGEVRQIKPLELFSVDQYSETYLRAYCYTRKEERTFRIDRLTLVTKDKVSRNPRPNSSPKTPELEDRVLNLIVATPGLKTGQITQNLGVEKKTINSILFGSLKGKIYQDKLYRWWTQDAQSLGSSVGLPETKKDTPLAKLCNYYLDCLGKDNDAGISVFASSKFSVDYAQIEQVPFPDDSDIDMFNSESAKGLLRKAQLDHNRLQLFLGYPIRLRLVQSAKGWHGMMVEPIILFSFNLDSINRNNTPNLNMDTPQINFKVLRSFSDTDSGNVIDESIQISDELGLNNTQSDIPDLDDLVTRLRAIRKYWDWREEPDPYKLSVLPEISKIEKPGIYNRAVLILGERSPYTQGLETELAALTKLDEESYKDTALGAWLNHNFAMGPTQSMEQLLEVLPLNVEQRQAVIQSLSDELTVITGPPGTGKSQVVTSILTNAMWQNKKVLFASKNNKAVDVVEVRTNSLGPRPILLRMGAQEHQTKLAEYLTSLLSTNATHEDESAYTRQAEIHDRIRQRLSDLDAAIAQTVELRNSVDKLEQSIEKTRYTLGSESISSLRLCGQDQLKAPINTFSSTLNHCNRHKQSFVWRSLWPLIRRKRYAKLQEVIEQSDILFRQLNIMPPEVTCSDLTFPEWMDFYTVLRGRMDECEQVLLYFSQLDKLTHSNTLENLSREYSIISEELSNSSELLWNYWLKLQPNRLKPQERRLLGEYGSVLQMIASANDAQQTLGSQVFRNYYTLFPQITNILSCWAITSLSARGRIPLEPAFFDLLIIDESSQCDIASALPLLYRAKRSVIIGDPQQLKHISSIPLSKDRTLLAKSNLIDGFSSWAYSVNSLFDLSRSLCRSEDIITLLDHHRSHLDIIKFSNDNFYQGRLRVATKYERLKPLQKDHPAIRWLDIKGNVKRPIEGGAFNLEEAAAVVKEIERIVFQNYRGTVGVVTPFLSQANKIRDMVQQNDSISYRLSEMDFLVHTVHRFQGDERDLMIFSPVVSRGITDSALRFLNNNPYLFNVAVTRARATLVVIGDKKAILDSGIDYLKRFALYVDKLTSKKQNKIEESTDLGPEYPPVTSPAKVSDWEHILYKVLYKAGVHTIPQYPADQYVIDLALFEGQRKLDIEVDGEKYHRHWDGDLCRRDQIRNQRLMELGWDVMRFWVYQIRDDMDSCLSRIQKWRKL